jgi:hypothetical protein
VKVTGNIFKYHIDRSNIIAIFQNCPWHIFRHSCSLWLFLGSEVLTSVLCLQKFFLQELTQEGEKASFWDLLSDLDKSFPSFLGGFEYHRNLPKLSLIYIFVTQVICRLGWGPKMYMRDSFGRLRWYSNPPRNDGKLLSKSESKSQKLAFSPSWVSSCKKNFCKHKTLVRTSDPKKSHKLHECRKICQGQFWKIAMIFDRSIWYLKILPVTFTAKTKILYFRLCERLCFQNQD